MLHKMMSTAEKIKINRRLKTSKAFIKLKRLMLRSSTKKERLNVQKAFMKSKCIVRTDPKLVAKNIKMISVLLYI